MQNTRFFGEFPAIARVLRYFLGAPKRQMPKKKALRCRDLKALVGLSVTYRISF